MTATISAPALTFQSTTFDVIDRNGQPWLRAHQIGEALEYKNPDRSLTNLFNANAAEFTDSMTAVVKLPTAGGMQDVRIFSLRGAHLLGMFARTKVAAEFRRWALDVLDTQVQPELSVQPGQFITAAQAGELSALIAERFPDGRDRPYAWGRFNNHFRIARYRELPAVRFAEACAYIGSMQPRALPALANTAASRIDAAYKMASHVAAVAAQAVFKAALSDDADDITYKYGRWLFCMDWNGTDPAPYVKRVDNDAMIVSLAKLPRYLADPGLLATSKELADISAACCQRLAQRMANPPAAPARRLSS